MKIRENPHDIDYADVLRLARKEFIVLNLILSANKEMYGLEMVEASNGELKRGTVYVTLQRLEARGFISSRKEDRVAPEIGIARRLYAVTGLGQRVIAASQAARVVLTPEFS